jgi:hypothetical protein
MMKLLLCSALSLVAAVQTAHAASCRQAMRHAYQVVDATGSEAMRRNDAEHPEGESVAFCEQNGWPEEVRDCLAAASSADEIYHVCYAIPFKGRELTVGRMFRVEEAAGLSPAPMSQNGDLMVLAPDCGFLSQSAPGGFSAIFVICDGQTRGPLTSVDDVANVFAAASADESNRHQVVVNLVRKTKVQYFGGDHRVCDRNGNCHIE